MPSRQPPSPAAAAKTSPAARGRKRSFETIGRGFHSAHDPVKTCLSSYGVPAALTTLGALGRMVAGPVLTLTALAGLVALNWAIGRMRGADQDRSRIDWTSAQAHEEAMRERVPAPAMAVIDETAEWIARRRGGRVHPYLLTCGCGAFSDRACVCPSRWSAGIMTMLGRAHRVIAVGDWLVASQPGVVRFVMAHERHHAVGVVRWSFLTRLIVASAGFVVVGALMSPGAALPMVVAGLMVSCTAWQWAEEIACDTAAARHHGAYAPRWISDRRVIHRRCKRAEMPGWKRAFRLAARALPQHPPLRIRAWVCRRAWQGHENNDDG